MDDESDDDGSRANRRPKQVFLDALEVDEPLRAAFLERRCAHDPDLRRRVDELLGAYEDARVLLGWEGPFGRVGGVFGGTRVGGADESGREGETGR